MFTEEAARVDACAERLSALAKGLNVEAKNAEIARLEQAMGGNGFWDDPEHAQHVVQKLKALKTVVNGPSDLQREIADAKELLELVAEEEDEGTAKEVAALVVSIEEKLHTIEMSTLFSDPRDERAVMLNIHPGAGGTESCDWADMLLRMILRFCERRAFEVEVVDVLPGEEAGIKSASLRITGPFAYGYLKSESGVHRLVRISPFDANKRRHTSFAAIEVLSEIDDDINIEVREEDLKMDVYRASGHGGQKVNKTSSAVRLTHMPTGIVTTCQIERSQHRNRATALAFLKAKLYDMELRKKEQELASQRQGQQDVAWGSQIRSYVLHPYQMIKDHRTSAETGSVDRVLDGDLEMFIERYLKWDLERKHKAQHHGPDPSLD